MASRIERIHQYVIDLTVSLINENNLDNNGADALVISLDLKLDRSNVSRELNKLWKEGKLIKIQGRPILFLDYATLKNEFSFNYIPLSITSENNISYYLNNEVANKSYSRKVNALNKIIGATNGSLYHMVENVIAAVSYKPNGLPILIEGNTGVRKRTFVNAIFDYTIEQNIKSKDCELQVINCQEYVDQGDAFSDKLFGSGNIKGALEFVNGGIVYLQNIHTLSDNQISAVVDCLSFGYFHRTNDNKRRKLSASVIASINDSCPEYKKEALSSIFPVIAKIPAFNNRNVYERIEMILNLFTDEAQAINRNIILSKSIVSIFAQNEYKENERQIINMIRFTCANCLLRNVKNEINAITIDINDLPYSLLSNSYNEEENSIFSRVLSLFEANSIVCERNGNCDCYNFFNSIQENLVNRNLNDFIAQFVLNDNNITNMDIFIENCLETITKCDDVHYKEIRRNVNGSVRMAFLKNLYNDEYYSLVVNSPRTLYAAMLVVSNYLNKNLSQDNRSFDLLENKEYDDASKICKELSINDITVKHFIARYLLNAAKLLNNSKVSLLLVCHGNTIASEYKKIISDKAKEYNVRVEALDYISSLQYNDILELIINKLKEMESEAGTAVLVDGYPLSDIEGFISKESETSCKVYSSLNLDMLFEALECSSNSYSLEAFNKSFRYKSIKRAYVEEDDFINKLIDTAFSNSLTHINPKRAVNVLLESLDIILDELKIIKTQEIIVKYLSHGVHMLERVIKRDTLEYYQLKRFTNANHDLMDIIAESLVGAENTFDIHIPSNEIAYLAEIFLEGI